MPPKGVRGPCSKCGAMDRYPRSATGGGGSCRPCAIRRSWEWHRTRLTGPNGAEYQRNKSATARLTHYKIDEATLLTMLDAQGGWCAICRAAPATHIDHDHATGQVRGVLCPQCNIGIGCLKESIANLEAAIRYLNGGR